MNQKHRRLALVRKPVQRVAALALREATTGRIIQPGSPACVLRTQGWQMVPRIWAVAETKSKPAPQPVGPAGFAGTNHVDPLLGTHRPKPVPELAFYRKYTEHLLRRYHRLSLPGGRVPSLLGREMFATPITNYTVHNFEQVAVFCVDIEKCLARLQPMERALLKRIAVQAYTHQEAATIFGISLRSCKQRYAESLDRMTRILLDGHMLEPLKSCQGGQEGSVGVSD